VAEKAIIEIVARANEALAEFDRLERKFTGVTEEMNASLEENLQTDEAVAEMEKLQKQVRDVGNTMQRAGKKSVRALRDMTQHSKMSDQALEEVENQIKQVETRLGRAARAMRTFGSLSRKVAKTTSKAFGGLRGAVVRLQQVLVGLGGTIILSEITKATQRQARAEAVLNAVLETTGGAAGFTAEELKKMAKEMQGVTLFGDEMVIEAQSIIGTFTKIGRDVFPDVIARVADLATIMAQGGGGEISMKAAAIQLGKALNDPIRGLSALAESGIQFSEAQADAIKAMVESNNLLGAQQVILKELETQFGGVAESARTALGGAFQALQLNATNLLEVIGKGGLLQALDKVAESILGVTEKAEEGAGGFKDFGRFMGILITAVAVLGKGLGAVRGIALGFGAALTKMFQQILIQVAGFTTFLQKIPGLGSRFEGFIQSVTGEIDTLGVAAADLGKRAEDSFRGLGQSIKDDFKFIKELIDGTGDSATALDKALAPVVNTAGILGGSLFDLGSANEATAEQVGILTTAAMALNDVLEDQRSLVGEATESVAGLEATVAELEGKQAIEGLLSPEEVDELFNAQDKLADSRLDLAEASKELEKSEIAVFNAAAKVTNSQADAGAAAVAMAGQFDLATQAAAIAASEMQGDLTPAISEVAVELKKAADGSFELVNTLADTGLVLSDAADGTKELTQAQDGQTVVVEKLADGTYEMKNATEEATEKVGEMIEALTDARTPAEEIQEDLEKIGTSANKGVSQAVGELGRLTAAAEEALIAVNNLNDGVGHLTDQAG
jgi:methyl-accepting chemotaxis protein